MLQLLIGFCTIHTVVKPLVDNEDYYLVEFGKRFIDVL